MSLLHDPSMRGVHQWRVPVPGDVEAYWFAAVSHDHVQGQIHVTKLPLIAVGAWLSCFFRMYKVAA